MVNMPAASPVFGSLRQLLHKSLLFRIVVLVGMAPIAAAVVLPLGWAISGNRAGLCAGAAAGGVCLLAAGMALILSEPLRKAQYMLALVLVGIIVRMGIPLAAALAIIFRGGPLADTGFLYYLIVFYPVTLTAKIFLSLRPRDSPATIASHGARRGDFRNEKNVPPAQNFVG